MKTFIFLFTIFIYSNINAQTKSIENLIAEIDNNQIHIVMQYVWYPEMKSEQAEEIIKMGKSVTPKIIALLDNPSKGIIAHFILSKIWEKNWGDGKSGNFVSINDNNFSVIHNELKIYVVYTSVSTCDFLYSKSEDLKTNKAKWEKFVIE
ncbi:hypothetical protein OX283_002770 [Flavobacterium sp. SUN052]|uniref:hypothetical protein n=1 Tax=Flavobacterium sp. SUN052 TaxID=3002441 RepID=UPI00237D7323|nr:hypothetical protein [Flavobacterium sp. SUN052]MEC4003569.1 hypothetical protein [Flavobacterium sp. SUN052]